MRYHIQTAPIWDVYREDGCPLCRLFAAKEKRLVKSYLNENVMDPHFRVIQNETGFCPEHIRMMYAGENKLGMALQTETRAAFLCDALKTPTDKKTAKKTADMLREYTGCVICNELADFMPRYYMTIAQMYENETEFPALFSGTKHCLKHATELYACAEYSGKKISEYLAALTDGLKRELKRTENELRDFADCFDHKSMARPDASALPRAIELLITTDLK